MRRKILQRCTVCGKYGAYCVPESGNGYWCYQCWYADWKSRHPEYDNAPTPPARKSRKKKEAPPGEKFPGSS